MHREAVRLAHEENRLVVMVEPIALYTMRDLLEDGDGKWMRSYPQIGERAPLGQVAVHGKGTDVAIVTYGNGRYLSTQAQHDLLQQGINARVIDLRWIAPLAEDAILSAVAGCDTVLIVDECRRTGGQAEALMALMLEANIGAARVTAHDSFIATGPAYAATLPSREGIVAAVVAMMRSS